MNPLAIERTPSACDAHAVDRPDSRPGRRPRVGAGDRLRRPASAQLRNARRAREPSRSGASGAGRCARLHRRDHGLGQPSLPRVLLCGSDDGRGAAHGECAHLPRAGALHDQPRRRRRDPRQRRVPAAARADSRQDPAGREVRADQRRTRRAAQARSNSPPSTSRCWTRRRPRTTSPRSTRTRGRRRSTRPAPPGFPRASTTATGSSCCTR